LPPEEPAKARDTLYLALENKIPALRRENQGYIMTVFFGHTE
jgi:hypothetical protein